MTTLPLPPPTPGSVPLLLQRHLSPARFGTYVRAADGDLETAVRLYEWNAEVAGALWEVFGHTEVVLRNAMHDALAARHVRRGRPGQWYDDPARELAQQARDDVATAHRRLRRAGAPPLPGKIIAELSFGFWRYLLAKRYTSTLWPAMLPAFPHLPGRDRRLLEAPVAGLHLLRNRVAHHEPLLDQPLTERGADALDVVGFVDPALRTWVESTTRLPAVLSARP